MRKILVALSLALASQTKPALACGGGYGDQVTIKPSQTIAVTYRGGEESYIFQPHFCGAATEFGLLLPVPATLTKNPTLGDAELFTQLERLAAPKIETVEVCASGGFLGSDSKGSDNSVGAGFSTGDGVYVVSSGMVGQFQWELLKADSTQSFTNWLDASKFAYPASATSAFDHYVQAGWYFVAFRVPTGANAPPAGYRLCGDFGPIVLSFQSARATVPTRIATANDTSNSFHWRVFTVADHTQTLSSSVTSDYLSSTRTYASTLSTSDLSNATAVASIANAGEWVTALDTSFSGGSFTGDIVVTPNAADAAYRTIIYVEKEVNCGVFGCSMRPQLHRFPFWISLLSLGAILGLSLRRK